MISETFVFISWFRNCQLGKRKNHKNHNQNIEHVKIAHDINYKMWGEIM